jgi:hypothetical protein
VKRKILAVLAALGLAAVITVAIQTPASATVRWGCPSGVACVFTGYSGAGDKLVISVGANGIGVCHPLPGFVFDNRVSSVTDDFGSDYDLWLYPNSTCDSSSSSEIFFSGECALTGMGGACNGPDSGQWSFNTIGLTKWDNNRSSFLIFIAR